MNLVEAGNLTKPLVEQLSCKPLFDLHANLTKILTNNGIILNAGIQEESKWD